MSTAFACFFSGLFILIVTKYNIHKGGTQKIGPMYDIIFLMIMVICMYFINASTMKERCGDVNVQQVMMATVFPWVIMYGITIGVLNLFPGWKQPFSNTFGYLISVFAGGAQKLKPLIPNPDMLDVIMDSPSLLINQFSFNNFDQIIQAMNFNTTEPSLTEFRNIVLMKELTSEFVWYILMGFVILTTSYNIIINYKCTIKDTDPPPPPPPKPTREYTV